MLNTYEWSRFVLALCPVGLLLLAAAGCDDQCVTEGNSYPVIPGLFECCPELVSVGCDAPGEDGQCTGCAGASFCTACGDGECGPGENECRCPEDCPAPEECVAEGDSYPIVPDHLDCCPGLVGVGCDEPDDGGQCMECAGASFCTNCGDGECGLGENECRCPEDCPAPEECVAEGDSYPIVPDHLDCCPGLVGVGCDEPDDGGQCMPCVGASFCTACDDGECGPGENECRCPEDCPAPEECVAEGDSYPIVPGHLECCSGLVGVGCDEPDNDGQCMPCAGASFCTNCGDGECGLAENECRCPADCPAAEECVAEGDSYPIVPGHLECCSGLVGVGCDEPDKDGQCMPCAGASFCTNCGDGECGLGENECRCPADCPAPEECVAEGDSYPIVPGHLECCSGLVGVGCDEPDNDGQCMPCAGASFCTNCGDGVCGLAENECRCPEDCPAPEECVAEGDSYPIVPGHLECCSGLVGVGCDEPDNDGQCMPCAGASFCTNCGDGVCGLAENECRCPEDCPAPEECVAEGDSYPIVPGHLECCSGLVGVGCDEPDKDGQCVPCLGASFCTNCGDRVCGLGENKCRCPEDCS